ncbi:MAG: DUF423 domain-containing protein [Hyphomonadaceae bacterium]|nr:MAG: hypothetical protein FD160_2196 [Caulobacteraceae bacterium]MBT9447068.1 DUF423 domain-containing protein [Hyphomonadaceae bacterium]TPW05002.1 MAG: hypothetical protein FD124_2364 [Alphaproteobacteria bacterium]
MSRSLLALAALHGFLAVAFGAFAAHGVDDVAAKGWLETGARYEALHAVAALVLTSLPVRFARVAGWLFIAGAALFAFSLYALAFGAPRATGMITPLGGVALLGGWGALLVGALTTGTEKTP